MAQQFRSLTALKRAVEVGTRIECTAHYQDARPAIPGRERLPLSGTTRTVTKVQTNGYYATIDGRTDLETGALIRWWAQWPKAKDVTLHEDGSWTVDYGGKGQATFRIVVSKAEELAAAESAAA